MLCITFVALMAGLSTVVQGQVINPNSVDQATRDQWCTDQKTSCPLICLQLPGTTAKTQQNTCDASTLVYSCVCSNGQSPNASEYSQTIPYYECTTANTQCVNDCPPSDSNCQSQCRTANPCGAQAPTRVNLTSSTSSTAAPTASTAGSGSQAKTTGKNTYTGFGGAQATGSSGSSGGSGSGSGSSAGRVEALALGFGRTYGLAAVLLGISGGFALLF